MKLSKFTLKNQKSTFNIILGLGLLIVIVVLVQYNKSKSTSTDYMTQQAPQIQQKITSVMASSPEDLGANYMNVAGISTTAPQNSCNIPQNIDPNDLLPKDMNSEWANVNPASNDLKNVNMLNASQLIGINTVGSSLRNANYQVRSEPSNPRVNVGPWNTSTIDTDTLRRPLEIGGCD